MPARTPFWCTASLLLAAATAPAHPQTPAPASTTPAAAPAFEVATIRPANPEDGRHWFGTEITDAGRFRASAVPLIGLVSLAYVTVPAQTAITIDPAAPKWIAAEPFDIQARLDNSNMTGWDKLSDAERRAAIRPTLQQLLADRFHLRLTLETRMTPVYVLLPAKGGTHLKEVPAPPPPGTQGTPQQTQSPSPATDALQPPPGAIVCTGDRCTGHAVTLANALNQIAANSRADRKLVDQTGLTGYYDLSFAFPSRQEEFPMQVVANDLGLRFVPRTLPIQTYVIQAATPPTLDGPTPQ